MLKLRLPGQDPLAARVMGWPITYPVLFCNRGELLSQAALTVKKAVAPRT